MFSHALLLMLDARTVLFDTFTELDRRAKRIAREDTICRRFMTVPGVGEIIASASRLPWTILPASRARGRSRLTSG